MTLRAGEIVFDRYEVEGLLDSTLQVERYAARHTTLGTGAEVRLFVGGTSTAGMARFRRAAEVMAEVRHANVLAVLDYGVHDDKPCTVTEAWRGESLAAVLARERALPWWAALDVIGEVLAGLEAIHAAGVVHRGIAPGVIVLDDEDEGVKVVDWSLAKAMDEGDTRVTQLGASVGAPLYMAPEQLRARPVSPRTDVFAVGLVLYEALAGELPEGGRRPSDTVKRLSVPPPPPAPPPGLPPVPASVSRVLLRALAADPKARVASARALAKALRAARASAAEPASEAHGHGDEQAQRRRTFRRIRAATASLPGQAERSPRPAAPKPRLRAAQAWSAMAARGALRAASGGEARGVPTTARALVALRAPTPARAEAAREAAGPDGELIALGHGAPGDGERLDGEGGDGERVWLGLVPRDRVEPLRRALEAGGDPVALAWREVSPGFALSAATKEGSAPPPHVALRLIESLLRRSEDVP